MKREPVEGEKGKVGKESTGSASVATNGRRSAGKMATPRKELGKNAGRG